MSSRSERTRAAIVDAASRTWLERGFNRAGLETIAEVAGVTRRTIYLHFADKAQLLLAVVYDVERRAGLPDLIGKLALAKTGAESIDILGEIQIRYVPQVYESIRLLHAVRREEPAAEEVWNNRMSGRRTAFRMVAEAMRDRGELAADLDLDDAVMLIWVLTSPHMYEYLVADGGWSLDRYRTHIVRLLRRALLSEQVAKAPGGDQDAADPDQEEVAGVDQQP